VPAFADVAFRRRLFGRGVAHSLVQVAPQEVTLMAMPKKTEERIRSALKRFVPVLESQRDRDVSEADTVTLVKDLFSPSPDRTGRSLLSSSCDKESKLRLVRSGEECFRERLARCPSTRGRAGVLHAVCAVVAGTGRINNGRSGGVDDGIGVGMAREPLLARSSRAIPHIVSRKRRRREEFCRLSGSATVR